MNVEDASSFPVLNSLTQNIYKTAWDGSLLATLSLSLSSRWQTGSVVHWRERERDEGKRKERKRGPLLPAFSFERTPNLITVVQPKRE